MFIRISVKMFYLHRQRRPAVEREIDDMQPVEEIRETDGKGSLRADRTVAQAQLSQKLIA
jgi:hypothetical protein